MFDGDLQVFLSQVSLDVDVVSTSAIVRPTNLEDRRIPLVVGASGHTDLREKDVDALLRLVGEILVDLKRRYPDTPLTILSALAEGADRLVARAALRFRDQYPNDVRLIVPLPMKLESYAKDFIDNPDSLSEFLELLKVADYWFERDLVKGNTEENIQLSKVHRNAQYQDVGKYIARHCQILIALWDGQETGLTGGTWEVVRFKTDGVKELKESEHEGGGIADSHVPPRSMLEPAETGPVYQIVTPRSGRPNVEGVALTVRKRYPSMFFADDTAAERHYAKIFRNINMFNRQSAADDRLRARIARSKRELLPGEVQRQLPVDSRAVLERYGVADALALRFAGTMRNVRLCIHGLALLGLASFEFFAHVQSDPNGPWQMTWLALALAFFLAAYLLYLWGAKFQDLYQDYRALAEGLRVQFFWRLADVDASVADYYLGKHRTELDWIRNALRNWSIPVTRLERDCRLDLALKYWVKDQYDYFRRRPDDEDARRISRCVKWCLVGAAVAALVYPSSLAVPSGGGWRTVLIITLASVLPLTFVAFLLSGAIRSIGKSWRHAAYAFGIGAILLVAGEIGFAAVRHSLKPSDSDTSRTVVTLVIALLLVFAALVQHYGEKMGFREHAKLYRHMRDLFDRALRHMNRAHSKQLQQELLHDLGIFALEENGDWVMLHRERPLEVPFG